MMVFDWAHWLREEKTKAVKRVRSVPVSSPGRSLKPGSKFSATSFHDLVQFSLGCGSWWSVAFFFFVIFLGVVGWINAWIVEKISNFLKKFGILPGKFSEGGLMDNDYRADLLENCMAAASEGDIKTFSKLMVLCDGNKALLETQSSCNNLGDTLIHVATRFGHSNIVVALLNAGVNIELRNRIGETPLLVAAESGQMAVAAVLLGRGASEDTCITDTGLKPIHLAAMFSHSDVAKLLLSRNPNSINYQESIRMCTPLHLAVGLDHPEMVRFLLEQEGICLSLRDTDGRTAYQLSNKFPEIRNIFHEFGVRH